MKPKQLEPTPEHLMREYKPPGLRECSRCAQELPYECFDKDASNEDGLKKQCKQCRSEVRKQHREKKEATRIQKIVETIEELDEKALKAVHRLSQQEIQSATIPHIATFLEEIMNTFGGPVGYARHYMATYLAAKPGGELRRKMLDRILGLATRVTESGAAEMPLDKMSAEELEQRKQEIEARMVRRLQVYEGEDGQAAG